jgi:predicted transcriptional regulator
MTTARQKFASQAPPDLLDRLRQQADAEGRQLQAVIEDAFREYLERRSSARPEVIAHALASLERNMEAYRRLAE